MSETIEEINNNTLTKSQRLLRDLKRIKEQIDRYEEIERNKPHLEEIQPSDKYDDKCDEECKLLMPEAEIKDEYDKICADYNGEPRKNGFVKLHSYRMENGDLYYFTKLEIKPYYSKQQFKEPNNVMPNYWKTLGVKPWMWVVTFFLIIFGVGGLIGTIDDPSPNKVSEIAWKICLSGAAALLVIPSAIAGLAYLFKKLSFIPKNKALKIENEKIKKENDKIDKMEAEYRVWKEEMERKKESIENSQEYLDWKDEYRKVQNEIIEKYDAILRKENEDIKSRNAEKSAKYNKDVKDAKEEMERNIQSIMDFPEHQRKNISRLISIVESDGIETLRVAIDILEEHDRRIAREEEEEELQHKINRKAKECRQCLNYPRCNKVRTEESLFCRSFEDKDKKWYDTW